jgi:hypothetical protein
MSETRFTPGPWKFSRGTECRGKPETGRFYVRGPHSEYITQRDALFQSAKVKEQVAADCMLMAAAPDLYAALTNLLEQACEMAQSLGYHHATISPLTEIDAACIALAKARGEQL